jgi:tRNA A-37 threonylcarbamoyl transferase component Bud32
MSTKDGQDAVVCRRSLTCVALYNAGLAHELKEMLWKQPELLVAAGQPLRCKGVRRTVLLSWGSQRFVLKHYVEPTRRHALKQMVHPSRARSTWTVTHRLAEAGVATPRPVACIENRWGALRRDSFLMYPYVEGRTLRSYFAGEVDESQSSMETLWRQLGDLWRRLAELRVSLADTNVGNFIVSPAGRLWVIDLDKARFHSLAYIAARNQQRGWKQLIRSAGKC